MSLEILMHPQSTFADRTETQQEPTRPLGKVQTGVEVGGDELIQEHAEKWGQLCNETGGEPFSRPEWIRVLLQCFEPKRKVVLITAHSGAKLSAVLPLVRKRCWFAGVPVTKLSAPANIHSVYFDIPTAAGQDGDESAAGIWKQLKQMPGWHIAELPLIPDKGASQELLARAKEDGYTTLLIPFHESPVLRMQADEKGQLNPLAGVSRHFRHELRRFAKLYRQETGQEPLVVRRNKPDPETLERFFQLEASGWKGQEQTAIDCAVETRNYYHQIARQAASAGYFSLYTLETDKGMMAGAYCVETPSCLFPMKIAYDERLHRAGPGQLLFNGILADCAARRIPSLFFGGKKNRFKTSWTSETIPFSTGFIFNRGVLPSIAYRSRVSIVSRLGSLRRKLKSRLRAE
jgi:CelD/BcsL family acetyltransferase involved in cellulose biosynthesis